VEEETAKEEKAAPPARCRRFDIESWGGKEPLNALPNLPRSKKAARP